MSIDLVTANPAPGGYQSGDLVFVLRPSSPAAPLTLPYPTGGGGGAVSSVAGRTGAVTLNHVDVLDWASATAGFGAGSTGVTSFNTRTGVITLGPSDITTALGYTPLQQVRVSVPLSGPTTLSFAAHHSHDLYTTASITLTVPSAATLGDGFRTCIYTDTGHTVTLSGTVYDLSGNLITSLPASRSTEIKVWNGQVYALIDFMVGNFTASAAGLVPLSGGGTLNYLRADGAWAAPASASGITIIPDTTLNGSSGQVAVNPAHHLVYLNPPNTSTVSAPTLFTLANGPSGVNAGPLTVKNISAYPCVLRSTIDGVSKDVLLYSPSGQNALTVWWDFNITSYLSWSVTDWGWLATSLPSAQTKADADIYTLTQSVGGTASATQDTLGSLKSWINSSPILSQPLSANITLSGASHNRKVFYTTAALTVTIPSAATLIAAGDFSRTTIFTDTGAMAIGGTNLLDYFNTLGGGIKSVVTSIPAGKKVDIELLGSSVCAMIYPTSGATQQAAFTTAPLSASIATGGTITLTFTRAGGVWASGEAIVLTLNTITGTLGSASGATLSGTTLTPTIGGTTASVVLTVTSGNGVNGTVSVAGTNIIASNPTVSVTVSAALVAPTVSSNPTISGTAQVGQVLTVADGSATGNPSPTVSGRQWYWADTNAAISGATATTYTLVSGDNGHTINCKVTWSNSQGTAVGTSAATVAVTQLTAPSVTSNPAISGTAQVGQVLTVTDGTASGNPSPTVSGRQWYLDGTSSISGATGTTYTPVSGDVGHTVVCKVTWSNSQGTAVGTSAATAAVTAGTATWPSLPGTGLNSSTISPMWRVEADHVTGTSGGALTAPDQSGQGHDFAATVGVTTGPAVGSNSLNALSFASQLWSANSGMSITLGSWWGTGVSGNNWTQGIFFETASTLPTIDEYVFMSGIPPNSGYQVVVYYDHASGHLKMIFQGGAATFDLGAAVANTLYRLIYRIQYTGSGNVTLDYFWQGTKTANAWSTASVNFGGITFANYGQSMSHTWTDAGAVHFRLLTGFAYSGAIPDANVIGAGSIDAYATSKWS